MLGQQLHSVSDNSKSLVCIFYYVKMNEWLFIQRYKSVNVGLFKTSFSLQSDDVSAVVPYLEWPTNLKIL